MKKKLKIQFIRNREYLAFCVLEQKGLPKEKTNPCIPLAGFPALSKDFIKLRGHLSEYDFDFASCGFGTAAEAEAKIRFFVDTITKELFSDTSSTVNDLKDGDKCLVRDFKNYPWEEVVFIQKCRDKFICKSPFSITGMIAWNFCKPKDTSNFKITKVSQEIHGTEITTCTWEEVE